MSDNFLTQLQAASSQEEREWLLLHLLLTSQPPAVQEAVWAAAIPHWFDLPFLAALLDKPADELEETFFDLTALSFVELFAGRGYNIHERSRHLLLRHLWQTDQPRYRTLSSRAAAACAAQDPQDPAWRVETIYHQLLADLPGATTTFAAQGIEWYNAFAYDKVETLTRTVLEAVQAGHIQYNRYQGEAAAWAYYRQGRLDISYSRNREARHHFQLALQQPEIDHDIQANCIKSLGDVHVRLAEYGQARERYEAALPIYRQIGDRLGEANCIRSLGDVHVRLAEYGQARERYEAALPIYRQIGARLGEANCIQSLGDVHVRLAEYRQARERYEAALPIYRQIGARLGEANCIQSLGDVHVRLDEYRQARERYEAALPIYRQIGDRLGEANCIQSLGDVHVQLDEYRQARERYEAALPIYRQIGDRLGEANCIKSLGDVHYYQKENEEAQKCYETSIVIYRQIGVRLGEMNSLTRLADLDRRNQQWQMASEKYHQILKFELGSGLLGNAAITWRSLGHTAKGAREVAEARRYYQQALELFQKIGSPTAKSVQADLAALE